MTKNVSPLMVAYDPWFDMWYLHDGRVPENSVGPFPSFEAAVTYLECAE